MHNQLTETCIPLEPYHTGLPKPALPHRLLFGLASRYHTVRLHQSSKKIISDTQTNTWYIHGGEYYPSTNHTWKPPSTVEICRLTLDYVCEYLCLSGFLGLEQYVFFSSLLSKLCWFCVGVLNSVSSPRQETNGSRRSRFSLPLSGLFSARNWKTLPGFSFLQGCDGSCVCILVYALDWKERSKGFQWTDEIKKTLSWKLMRLYLAYCSTSWSRDCKSNPLSTHSPSPLISLNALHCRVLTMESAESGWVDMPDRKLQYRKLWSITTHLALRPLHQTLDLVIPQMSHVLIN